MRSTSRAHDAEHAAEAQVRRHQHAFAHQEDVAGGAADQLAFGVEHQAFVDRLVVPLRLREHLLEPIEMLDAGEARVAPEPRLAPAQREPRGRRLAAAPDRSATMRVVLRRAATADSCAGRYRATR